MSSLFSYTVPTRPAGDSSHAAASTAFVSAAIAVAPIVLPQVVTYFMTGTSPAVFGYSLYLNLVDRQTNAAGINSGLLVGYNIGNTSTPTVKIGSGAKIGIQSLVTFSNPTNNVGDTFASYIGANAQIYVNSGDNGVLGTTQGNFYGLAGGVFVAAPGQPVNGTYPPNYLSGATNELDCSITSGSVGVKNVLALVAGGLGGGADRVQGSLSDTMLALCSDSPLGGGASNNIGFNIGITFGREDSHFPIKSTGTLLKIIGTGPTCADGIDIRNCTFSGYSFRAPSFDVSQGGDVFAHNYVGPTFTATSATAPGTPPAGQFYVYMDTADNKLKAKGPGGTVTTLANP